MWVAPNATVVGDVDIDDDSSVWYGAVVRGILLFLFFYIFVINFQPIFLVQVIRTVSKSAMVAIFKTEL